MTSPLTSQYTYLCMNTCSAWGYFQLGGVQTQGQRSTSCNNAAESKIGLCFSPILSGGTRSTTHTGCCFGIYSLKLSELS